MTKLCVENIFEMTINFFFLFYYFDAKIKRLGSDLNVLQRHWFCIV